MNDDQRLLANAYLDGEVSAEERARAEADPEVVAEIARLRAVSEALRVTDEPDPQRREAAIHAALDAFELRPAATIATTPELPVAPPVSLDARRRARWLRPLAAAAAVVVLIAGGVALLRDRDEDGGDDASSLLSTQELTPAATGRAEVAADEAGTEAPADTVAAGAAATTTAVTDLTAAAPEAAGEATAILTSPAQLARFAAAARSAPPATEETNADATFGCPLGERVGSAVYERDGQAVAVDVFIAEGEAIAADPTTCEVVARAQLP